MARPGRVTKAPSQVLMSPRVERELELSWQGCTFEGFKYYCENYLQIRTGESGEGFNWEPFVLNEEQEHFAKLFIERVRRRQRIRFFVLKARKLGFSTLIQALAHWLGAWLPGWKSKTIAQLDDSTAEIFSIATSMNEKLPDEVSPFLAAVPHKGWLRWPNGSSIQVETQRSETKSRGGSPSLLHMSEFAHWEVGRKKGAVARVLAAMLGSLEEGGGGASAAVVVETTANGIGGPAYDKWQEAQSPESGWIPLFYPWQTARKYQFPDEHEGHRTVTAIARGEGERDAKIRAVQMLPWVVSEVDKCSDKRVTAELIAERAVDFAYTGGQLGFMFRKIADFSSLDTFDQEFPSSAELAFVSAGGRPVFDTPSQRVVRLSIETPRCRRGLLRDTPWVPETMEAAEAASWDGIQWFASAAETGDAWWIWRPPVPGWRGRYGVGVDPSNGAGKDYGAIEVIDYLTGEQVAQFYSNTATGDVLAEQAMFIGRWYGDALIIPEFNGPGGVVVKDLWSAGYPNVWRRTAPTWDRAAAPRPDVWSTELGLYVEARMRQVVITGAVKAVRDNVLRVRSSRTAAEIRTFRFDATGRPDHAEGCFSDSIMALSFGLYGREQVGLIRKVEGSAAVEREEGDRSFGSRLRRQRPSRRSEWFGNRR